MKAPLYRFQTLLVKDSIQKIPAGVIDSEQKAAAILRPHFFGVDQEILLCMSLDNQNQFLGLDRVSTGTDKETISHPKFVYRLAVHTNAVGIILAHNHPSNSLVPSDDDLRNFKLIKDAGEIMGIQFLDHLIFGNVQMSNDFYSWKRDGGYK